MNSYQKKVIILSVLLCVLVLATSLIAISREDGGVPRKVLSPRGENVELYGGTGIYRFDTVKKALMQRAYDLYYLVAGLPLLVIGMILYLRRSAFGFFLFISSMLFFFYSFLLSSIGIAYNEFFLAYIAVCIISVFAVIYTIKSISMERFSIHVLPQLRKKAIGAYNLIVASYFIITWLIVDFSSLLTGSIHPDLAIYTTADQNVTDLGLYAPAAVVAAILLLKNKTLGAIFSVGIMLMAFQTFVALSIFSFLDIAFHQEGLEHLEFVMLILGLVSFILIIALFSRLKTVRVSFNLSGEPLNGMEVSESNQAE